MACQHAGHLTQQKLYYTVFHYTILHYARRSGTRVQHLNSCPGLEPRVASARNFGGRGGSATPATDSYVYFVLPVYVLLDLFESLAAIHLAYWSDRLHIFPGTPWTHRNPLSHSFLHGKQERVLPSGNYDSLPDGHIRNLRKIFWATGASLVATLFGPQPCWTPSGLSGKQQPTAVQGELVPGVAQFCAIYCRQQLQSHRLQPGVQ